ncbi:MAG TPA: 3'(2'),5'-bisphosphate nucleotidase CysQ, partial [Vulgatibacter sp.]
MRGSFTREIDVASRLAREAGRAILEVYATDFDVVEKPSGGGPVTIADQRANDIIVAGLRAAFPGDGVVAEESDVNADPARFERCWFVDPLDGTKEFTRRNDQFAVHVGLAVGGEAKAGVVFQPTADRLFAGVVGEGCVVWQDGVAGEVRVPAAPHDPLRLVASRSHRSRWIDQIQERLDIARVEGVGSVGIKCGMVAAGVVDLYVHPSRVSFRWDACAPEAVLRAAGGFFADLAGRPYRY